MRATLLESPLTGLAIVGEQLGKLEDEESLSSLRIGDLAKATGKTNRALRLYEELGLLIPGERSSGGFRQYAQAAIHRVRWISKLQDIGFTLQEIKLMLLAVSGEPVPREAMQHVQNIFQEKLNEVSSQLKRLATLSQELSGALEYLEECHTCQAEDAGPSTCLDCNEHDEPEAPSLLREVTKASLQLLHSETKHSEDPLSVESPPLLKERQHLAHRGPK
jgi:MerR family copper efflux transcriptional regulator